MNIQTILEYILNFLGVLLGGIGNGGVVVLGLLSVPFLDRGWQAYSRLKNGNGDSVEGQVEVIDNLLAGGCAIGFLTMTGDWKFAVGGAYLLLKFFYCARKYPKKSRWGQIWSMPGEIVNDIDVLSAFAAGLLWVVWPLSGVSFWNLFLEYLAKQGSGKPSALASNLIMSTAGVEGLIVGALTLSFFWTLWRYLREGMSINQRGTLGPLLLCYVGSMFLLLLSLSVPVAWLFGLIPLAGAIALWTWYTRVPFYIVWDFARPVIVENCTLLGLVVMILFFRGGYGTPETFAQYWSIFVQKVAA